MMGLMPEVDVVLLRETSPLCFVDCEPSRDRDVSSNARSTADLKPCVESDASDAWWLKSSGRRPIADIGVS